MKAKKKQIDSSKSDELYVEKGPIQEENEAHQIGSEEAAASKFFELDETAFAETEKSKTVEEADFSNNSMKEMGARFEALEKEFGKELRERGVEDTDDASLLFKKELESEKQVQSQTESNPENKHALRENESEEKKTKEEKLPNFYSEIPGLTAFYEEFRKISAEREKQQKFSEENSELSEREDKKD
ncbi:MAG: hypothetical protein LRY73_07765 [Bacillus sp. (in: Bacteria)]|nr:hypothetical protein [Bacillus sp. (in: firmicutes)]